jgi:hypothetical protein
MLEVAEADLEPGFVRPQACRKSVAERVDANDRAFRASRWRRGSVARTRCTDLTVEGDRETLWGGRRGNGNFVACI